MGTTLKISKNKVHYVQKWLKVFEEYRIKVKLILKLVCPCANIECVKHADRGGKSKLQSSNDFLNDKKKY